MGPIGDRQDPGGPMLAPWTLLSGQPCLTYYYKIGFVVCLWRWNLRICFILSCDLWRYTSLKRDTIILHSVVISVPFFAIHFLFWFHHLLHLNADFIVQVKDHKMHRSEQVVNWRKYLSSQKRRRYIFRYIAGVKFNTMALCHASIEGECGKCYLQ